MNVVVLFGGKSTEHEISCISAAFILSNLSGHRVCRIGITRDGRWLQTDADDDEIRTGAWEARSDNADVTVDLNRGAFCFNNAAFAPDVVFPVLHGKNGEDGTVQGLLEVMNVPYVGCRVLGSAVCMDKAIAKAVFASAGINQAPFVLIEKGCSTQAALAQISEKLRYPIFIKPANAGSSIGITKCADAQAVPAALDAAFAVDRRVVAEQGLEAIREVEVAVLGNGSDVQASVTGMIRPSNEFYDYEAKYVRDDSALIIPSGVPQEQAIRALAVQAYRLCDCQGLARVDFMVDANGEIYLNEINTLPGFTPISMYPMLFKAGGLDAPALIEKLLALALEFAV